MADIDYTEQDEQRYLPEAPKSALRTAFARDRARILHSSALRRLGAKSQIHGPATDDFVRTRLTHSLEVAQVGRELGKALGCDPDVVDTACLAHDLGHPPFGHNGEKALAELCRDIGGFEGNAQTFRVVTRLEPKVIAPNDGRCVGLNLTRASLDACIKYPWTRDTKPGTAPGQVVQKFNVYDDDIEVFEWLRDPVMEVRTSMEAQVMDLSDDISYSVHDLEDGVVFEKIDPMCLNNDRILSDIIETTHRWYGDRISADELAQAAQDLVATPFWVQYYDHSREALAALKDMTSQLIGRFCEAAWRATRERYGNDPLTRYNAQLMVPKRTEAEILLLKGLAAHFVMDPREREPEFVLQRKIVQDLVEVLFARAPYSLQLPFAVDWQLADSEDEHLRAVVDQVASLTDDSAYQWHTKLCGRRGSV